MSALVFTYSDRQVRVYVTQAALDAYVASLHTAADNAA